MAVIKDEYGHEMFVAAAEVEGIKAMHGTGDTVVGTLICMKSGVSLRSEDPVDDVIAAIRGPQGRKS